MNTRNLFVGLLAISLVSGCAQQKTAKSNKDRVYYHDRRVGLGTNIPRTYNDSASANAPQAGMSEMDREQFQQFNNGNTGAGQAQGTGGH